MLGSLLNYGAGQPGSGAAGELTVRPCPLWSGQPRLHHHGIACGRGRIPGLHVKERSRGAAARGGCHGDVQAWPRPRQSVQLPAPLTRLQLRLRLHTSVPFSGTRSGREAEFCTTMPPASILSMSLLACSCTPAEGSLIASTGLGWWWGWRWLFETPSSESEPAEAEAVAEGAVEVAAALLVASATSTVLIALRPAFFFSRLVMKALMWLSAVSNIGCAKIWYAAGKFARRAGGRAGGEQGAAQGSQAGTRSLA